MKLCMYAWLLLFSAVNVSPAAVHERDWKTPGDGLLTYDDLNKREWLDLSQTIHSSQFPGEDPSPLLTLENRYQYVVSQTLPGGPFEGFIVAKSPEVIALAQSADIDTTTSAFAINSAPAESLGQLLSFTRVSMSGNQFAIGLLGEPSSSSAFRLSASVYVDVVSGASGLAGLQLSTGYTQFPASPPGVFLYRTVPEPRSAIPSAVALVFGCLIRYPRIRFSPTKLAHSSGLLKKL